MRTFAVLAAGLVVSLFAGRAGATQFAVTPESGAWLILVQSYSGEGSAKLADDLCATLRRDYHLNAYVFNRGEEERAKERDRIAKIRQQQIEFAKANGIPADAPLPKIKTIRIEEQYAVLVGG